jgi:hypothetical protein
VAYFYYGYQEQLEVIIYSENMPLDIGAIMIPSPTLDVTGVLPDIKNISIY